MVKKKATKSINKERIALMKKCNRIADFLKSYGFSNDYIKDILTKFLHNHD